MFMDNVEVLSHLPEGEASTEGWGLNGRDRFELAAGQVLRATACYALRFRVNLRCREIVLKDDHSPPLPSLLLELQIASESRPPAISIAWGVKPAATSPQLDVILGLNAVIINARPIRIDPIEAKIQSVVSGFFFMKFLRC